MVRLRSISPLATLAVVAALLAGCGSSSSSSGSSAATGSTSAPSTSTAAPSTSATTPTGSTASTPTSSTGTTSTGTTPTPPTSSTAVARCRRGVHSLPHLKQSTRSRLEALCGHANDDPEAMRKAAVEACREIVNASPLPAGPQKERALRTCDHAGGSKGSGK